MSWRLSEALVTLRAEVEAAHPGRSKASDGTKGDDAHAARKSDHNPDADGIVHAWDCTVWDDADADFADDVAGPLAEFLRAKRDVRTKYVIHRGRMFASYTTASRKAWEWGPYSGPNGHFHHVHVSVYGDDGAAWGYPATHPASNPEDDMPYSEKQLTDIVAAVVKPLADDLAEVKRQVSKSQDAKAPGGRTLRHICASDLAKD